MVHSREYGPLLGFDMTDWLFLVAGVAVVTFFAEVFVL
jgi:low affinity Fe/Cu permease